MLYKTLPYTFPKNDTEYKRLIVKPFKIPSAVGENGLIEPERESTLCEMGHVVSAGEESDFKEGDEVFYNKLDRSSDALDTIEIDGEACDVIFENEVWCLNEKPRGRVFVEPFSELEANDFGVLIPEEAKGITQKGRVIAAPPEYLMQPGDLVEFRKQEMDIFPEVELNGTIGVVLYEADIFKVNGKAAPWRIIVKIDAVAQHLKRTSTPKGLTLSPMFMRMLRNMQIGEVVDIGEEAKKMHPEVEIGNTLIVHHVIEHQPYRLISREYGKLKTTKDDNALLYEYRAINCWDPSAREIFGKVNYERSKNRKKETADIRNITPLNGSVFLKWEFNVLDVKSKSESAVRLGTDFTECHNLEDLNNVINHTKGTAAENAKIRVNGIRSVLQQIDPEFDKERYDVLESQLRSIQREETRIAAYINRNHLVVCKRIYPDTNPAYVIAPYEQLYPIKILGHNFLIANEEFIYAQSAKNMDISTQDIFPLGKWAIIEPIIERKETDLIVPHTAEVPQKGTVIGIDGHKSVTIGDTILFRRGTGLEQDIQGKTYLLMRHEDLIAFIPKQKDENPNK